jgi:hypothetical protein
MAEQAEKCRSPRTSQATGTNSPEGGELVVNWCSKGKSAVLAGRSVREPIHHQFTTNSPGGGELVQGGESAYFIGEREREFYLFNKFTTPPTGRPFHHHSPTAPTLSPISTPPPVGGAVNLLNWLPPATQADQKRPIFRDQTGGKKSASRKAGSGHDGKMVATSIPVCLI